MIITKPHYVIPPPWPGRIMWYLFGNADDGARPSGYLTSWPTWAAKAAWWIRNPFHNLMFYGIGFVNVPCRVYGKDPSTPLIPGWNWTLLEPSTIPWMRFPFISYMGHWVEWYIGWRPDGAFGLKLRRS